MAEPLRLVRPDLDDAPLPGMIGSSPGMRDVYRLVRRVAPLDDPVAIVGETGTGKELVAQALHALSPRRGRPLVALNAVAVPESVFESELFGHERGAFSDAKREKAGLVEIAHRGTLYLDELGALSEACQAKLLRVIEEGMARRVGGVTLRPAAPRWVVSCQARDPMSRIGRGIREDLWQRVSGAIITLPPLRQRAGDIPLLVAHFLTLRGYPADWFEGAGVEFFGAAPWRGNVRELKQVVGRLVLSHDGKRVSADAVRRELEGETRSGRAIPIAEPPTPAVDALVAICEANGWQTPRIAAALGVGRTTLFKRLKAWGVSLRSLREFTIVHRSSLNSRELR